MILHVDEHKSTFGQTAVLCLRTITAVDYNPNDVNQMTVSYGAAYMPPVLVVFD